MKNRKAVSALYTIVGMMACLIIGFVSGYFIGLSHSGINLESSEHISPYNQTRLSDWVMAYESEYTQGHLQIFTAVLIPQGTGRA